MAVDGYLNFNTKINTKGFNAGIKQITNGLAGMKSMLGKISGAVAVAFSVRELVNFSKEAVNLASDIQEVQNVVDVSFGHLKGQMEEFAATSIQNYGISKLTAKQTGSTYMAMAKGMQIADETAAKMATTLTGLSADMASFYNKDQNTTATALNSIFTGETETLKQFGIVMTEANLQQFAYTQGISSKISAMSQAEKVQLRYNYVMQQTALAQGDFVRTQDGWANQTRIISEMWKEFAGTVGTILMNTLLPAVQNLNKAMAWLNNIAQSVLETLAAVFSWDLEANNAGKVGDAIGDAVENQNDLTDAVNETVEAQERQLMGFDKINKLNDSNSSDTSVSDSSSVLGGSYEIPVDIDTEKVEKKLTAFQEKLKEFVTSLKITFNDVFFDWKDLTGEQIAEKIITSISAIAGSIIGFAVGGIPGAAIGMTIGAILGVGITSLMFNHDGEFNTDEIVGMIVSSLCTIAGGIIGFSVGGPLGAAVGASLGLGLSLLINQLDWGTLWEDLKKGFSDILGNLKKWFTDKKADLSDAWSDFTSVVKDKTAKMKAAIGTKVDDLKKAWSKLTLVVKDKTAKMKADIGTKVDDLKKAWSKLTLVVKEKTAKMKATIGTKVKDLKEVWSKLTSVVKEKTAKMKATIGTKVKDLKEVWSKLTSVVKNKTAQMKADIATKVDDFRKNWNARADIVQNKTAIIGFNFSQTIDAIRTAAKDRYDAIIGVFSNISNWFKTEFSEAWQNVKDVFSSGGKVFEGIKDGILNGLKKVINALIDGINKVIAKPFEGINTALEKVKNTSIGGSKPFEDKISTINVPKIPKLATGTVVPANYGEFLAILGDNKRETEVVSPLSTIKKAVSEVIGKGNEQNINLTVELDGEVVYRKVVKKNKQNTKKTGVNELATA
jgi:hypothetical protein